MRLYTVDMDKAHGNFMRETMIKRSRQMSPVTRLTLGRQILRVQEATGMGPTGAMELLYRLGTWLNVNDADSLKYSSDGKNQEQVQTLKYIVVGAVDTWITYAATLITGRNHLWITRLNLRRTQ